MLDCNGCKFDNEGFCTHTSACARDYTDFFELKLDPKQFKQLQLKQLQIKQLQLKIKQMEDEIPVIRDDSYRQGFLAGAKI